MGEELAGGNKMARLSIAIVMLLFWVLHCATLPVLADSREAISPLLVRAQLTKWPLPTRNPPPRIHRDDQGRIVSLFLDGVELEAGDIDAILSFRQLERLSLSLTTISDRDLARLADLPRLQGLRLNHTAIGDDGVASLAKFSQLKSVCMFRIQASRKAIQALKHERRELAIGYVPFGG
jgi:hypothetical protein